MKKDSFLTKLASYFPHLFHKKNKLGFHVAFAADQNYAVPLLVATTSVARHFHPEYALTIWIFDQGISSHQKAQISQCLREIRPREKLNIEWIPISAEKISAFPVGLHFSSTAYVRLFMADLMPSHIEYFLYLDSDILALQDISPLFTYTPKETQLLSAARDLLKDFSNPMAQLQNVEQFNISPQSPYFNSGVLLIHAKRWREEKISQQIASFIQKHPEQMFLVDQNAINLFLHGRIGEIPFRFNHQTVYKKIRSGEWQIPLYTPPKENPSLLHFTSEEKPWLEESDPPHKHLWLAEKSRAIVQPN